MDAARRTKVEEALRAHLAERYPAFDPATPSEAGLDGLVDSLGLFELVEWVEASFSIRIPNEEFSPARFSSIEAICATVDEFSAD